ncbi:MAG: Wzz/FepE/Etk N-terminal domain-containing protein, partial [Actinomycetota bacterium]
MREPSTETYAVDLRQYLAILKARKWTIIACAALGLVIALILSAQQTPLYSAEARLLVKDAPGANWFPNAEDEAQVVKSVQVADLVRRDLGLTVPARSLLGGLTAEVIGPDTNTIAVTYISEDPVLARNAANSFARNYGIFKQGQLSTGIRAERERLQARITSLTEQLSSTIQAIQAARQEGDATEAARLDGEKTQLSIRIASLQQELDNTPSTSSIALGVGDVLEAASTPEDPFSPDH